MAPTGHQINILRRRLQEITDAAPIDVPIATHPRLIEEARKIFPHTIIPIEHQTSLHFPRLDNCGSYAMGFSNWSEFSDLHETGYLDYGRKIAADRTFLEWLIRKRIIARRTVQPPNIGDFVAYFNGKAGWHIGRLICGDRVRSKWGVGLVYEHGLKEVPISYGRKISYYSGLADQHARDAFLQYAAVSGVHISDGR